MVEVFGVGVVTLFVGLIVWLMALPSKCSQQRRPTRSVR